MLPVLREQLKVINPWLEDDQVEEVVKQLTASFPGTGLIQNNRHVFNLLLENTSVSENRKTGEKSPTVRFVDFQPPGQQPLHRRLPVQGAHPRHRAPHHPGHRAVPERPAGGGDRVQVAQGEGADPRGHRPAAALQRTARRQGRRQRAALLLQPVRHRHLPAGGQVRHDHHPQREAFLPLGRPVSPHRGRSGARRAAAPTTSSAWWPGCWTATTCSTSSAPSRSSPPTTRARSSRSSGAISSSAPSSWR